MNKAKLNIGDTGPPTQFLHIRLWQKPSNCMVVLNPGQLLTFLGLHYLGVGKRADPQTANGAGISVANRKI